MSRLLPFLAVIVASLAACASGPRMNPAERRATLEAHAGEPVNSIRHPGRFSGWSAVGSSALVLHTRPSEAFLLDLTGPCSDLPFAHAIHVSSRAGSIASRFDYVLPMGPGTSSIRIRCHIRSIRPLDVAALRQSQQELREATSIEREDDPAQQEDSGD